jgi:hypothetical protein
MSSSLGLEGQLARFLPLRPGLLFFLFCPGRILLALPACQITSLPFFCATVTTACVPELNSR